MENTQMTLSIQEAQELYSAGGGEELGVQIDVFKAKRWLKCKRGLVLAAWEETNEGVENFKVVVKKAKVTPVAPLETPQDPIDYPMLAAMTAVGGPGFGMGATLFDVICKSYQQGRARRMNG